MCPGCMTAAALQEFGTNPARNLLAALYGLLARPAAPRSGPAPGLESEEASTEKAVTKET